MLYYTTWKTAFPKSSIAMIGNELDGVERIFEFWDYVDEADIIVMPDIYEGDLQMHLREMGHKVWGSGRADKLEIDRKMFREKQSSLGMNVPKYKVVHGTDELKEYLMKHEDQYVKVSAYRGDVESFHHETWDLTEPYLEDLEFHLGPKKYDMEFLVESPISGVEIGIDTWCIDGKFPQMVSYGYEEKDKCYLGRILPYQQLPAALKTVNEPLSATLKEMGLRGFYSNEVRIGKDRKPYLVDPCVRMASPPGEVMMESFSNLGEVIWHGADGELIQPKPNGNYTAMAHIYSDYASENWVTLEIPDEIRKYVKVKSPAIIDGKIYCVPQGFDLIGSVVYVGKTMQDAIENVKRMAKEVKGFGVEVHTESFDNVLKTINEGKQYGILFG